MATEFNNLMSNHVDNDLYPQDLGDDAYKPYRVLVGADGRAEILWREELRFHRELADADAERISRVYRPWSHYTDAGGVFLTAENEALLVDELKRLTKVNDIETMEDGDPDPESGDGYIAFSISVPYQAGETVVQWVDRIGWRVIATLINATDPGTFNYPYLFSAMLYAEAR